MTKKRITHTTVPASELGVVVVGVESERALVVGRGVLSEDMVLVLGMS